MGSVQGIRRKVEISYESCTFPHWVGQLREVISVIGGQSLKKYGKTGNIPEELTKEDILP